MEDIQDIQIEIIMEVYRLPHKSTIRKINGTKEYSFKKHITVVEEDGNKKVFSGNFIEHEYSDYIMSHDPNKKVIWITTVEELISLLENEMRVE